MDLSMLQSGATYNYVSYHDIVDQPEIVLGTLIVEAEIPDCWIICAFLGHSGVEVTKHDFNIMAGLRSSMKVHKLGLYSDIRP